MSFCARAGFSLSEVARRNGQGYRARAFGGLASIPPPMDDSMTDIPNSLPDHHGATLLAAPDTEVDAREVFGVDIDMKVPAFSEADERVPDLDPASVRSEEYTSELQSLMRISYAVFCLKKKKQKINTHNTLEN